MMSSSEATAETPFQPISAQYTKFQRQYQQILDKVTPFVFYRWLSTFGVLVVFLLRIVFAQGVSCISLPRAWL